MRDKMLLGMILMNVVTGCATTTPSATPHSEIVNVAKGTGIGLPIGALVGVVALAILI